MFIVTITPEELRKALAEVEIAESNGFSYSSVVLKLDAYGNNIGDCRMKYVDLCLKAHPTDRHFDYGRSCNAHRTTKFENGKLLFIPETTTDEK